MAGTKVYKPKQNKAKKNYAKKPARSMARPKSSGFFENIGKNVGSYFGKTGAKVGQLLGKTAGVITGMGSYEIHKNSLLNEQVPFVHSTNEVVRIKHREFLGNVNGSVNFAIQSYNVNPGLASVFPWLYSTALSFEQYKIEGMIIEFVSTCGDAIASTNNALGTVCLSTDYNVVNNDFVNMAQCQNSMWSSTGKPSKNIVMPIECDGKLNVLERLFIRNNQTNLNNSDLRLYDHCKFNLATEGQQVSTQIGQLWISYDISFYKPVLTDIGLNAVAHYYNSAPVNGNVFSFAPVKNYDSIGIKPDGNVIYFPVNSIGKKYQVAFMYYNPAGGTTTITPPTLTFVNCTGNFILTAGTDAAIDAPATSFTTASYVLILEITITNNLVAQIGGWGSGIYPAGSPRMDLIVNSMY